jgi:DNA-binding MarR family transcriptional regulator
VRCAKGSSSRRGRPDRGARRHGSVPAHGSVTRARRQTEQPLPAGQPAGTVLAVTQQWLDDDQQRTWRAWLAVTELLPRSLDAQLQRDAGLTHAAYIVLAMLSEAPDRSRRMSDLARVANQSQSRLSHTVARLEERGWVRRERAAEDRRGNLAVLTDEGWDVVQRVAPGHVVAVREGLFAALTPAQTEALGEALTAVLDRLDPDHTLRVPELG